MKRSSVIGVYVSLVMAVMVTSLACFVALAEAPGEKCECGGQTTVAAAEFCTATCPKSVGGVKCGAQCKLTKDHSGGHLCIKLHDF